MNTSPKTLAIFSPGYNCYSETFIRAHETLPYKIKHYYGGYFPSVLEGCKSLISLTFSERIEKKMNGNFNLQQFALYKSLQREKVDCILAEYGVTAAETFSVIKKLQLPLVVHFHGFDASVYDILKKYSSSYKNVFEYAKCIIAVSNKMKTDLINLGCPPGKIVVTACGPANIFLNASPNYSNKQFLSVGRFVEKKAPYLAILAFQKVVDKYQNSKLIMVGEGELLAVCRNLTEVLGLSGKVEFKGVQTPEQIKNLMEQSIAFVQHSIVAQTGDSEGTPVAVLEAQASAIPVISTNHAGIPEVVIHGETGFLMEEKDITGMAEYMLRILTEPGLAKELGEKGRQKIKSQFSQHSHLNLLQNQIDLALGL